MLNAYNPEFYIMEHTVSITLGLQFNDLTGALSSIKPLVNRLHQLILQYHTDGIVIGVQIDFVHITIIRFSYPHYSLQYHNQLCKLLVGPSSPEGAQLTVRGGGFLFPGLLFLGLLLVVYVFVVCISLRDDGR
jgi:hypothetical protein